MGGSNEPSMARCSVYFSLAQAGAEMRLPMVPVGYWTAAADA